MFFVVANSVVTKELAVSFDCCNVVDSKEDWLVIGGTVMVDNQSDECVDAVIAILVVGEDLGILLLPSDADGGSDGVYRAVFPSVEDFCEGEEEVIETLVVAADVASPGSELTKVVSKFVVDCKSCFCVFDTLLVSLDVEAVVEDSDDD